MSHSDESYAEILRLEAEVERLTKERDEAEAWAINLAKIVGGCRNLKTDNPSWGHIKACVMDGIVGRAEAWNRALAAEAQRDEAVAALREWLEAHDGRLSGGASYKLVCRLNNAMARARAVLAKEGK